MKKRYLLLSILTLVFLNFSVAQNVEHTQTPVIKKGYYSIGNNSGKLYKGLFSKPDTVVPHQMSKGYYTIGAGTKTLKKPKWRRMIESNPVASKGYHTIGMNSERADSAR